MDISGQLIRIEDVSSQQRDEMFALMQRHYENMRREEFEADLDEKDWVILAERNASREICGFSTQMLIDHALDQKRVSILFSGDTIVDPDYWGRNPLAQIWGRMVLSLIDQRRDTPLFWFLISKGYRTYRFLPIFFSEFFPRFDQAMPAWADRLIQSIARHKYASRFHQESGVIPASASSCRLRGTVADVTPQRLADPHVRFFCERNPGYARGDELCCIAPLTRANFNARAYRVIGREEPVGL